MSLVSRESVAVIMTNDEARECVERIRAGIDGVRAEVLRLHEGDGWKSLGYESWRECVTAEFGQSKVHLYRLLDAAQIEREIAPISQNASHEASVSPMGETEDISNGSRDATLSPTGDNVAIPERILRPLKPLLGDPDTMRRVWNEVVDEHGPQPTAADVAAKVSEVIPPKMTPGERDKQEALARMSRQQAMRDEQPRPPIFSDTTVPASAMNHPKPGLPDEEVRFRKVFAALMTLTDVDAEEWAEEIVARGSVDPIELRLASVVPWLERLQSALRKHHDRPMSLVK